MGHGHSTLGLHSDKVTALFSVLAQLARRFAGIAVICGLAFAEQGVLVVHVSDPQDRPIQGVSLATQGDGSTGAPTSGQGRTRIRLAAQTRAKTWVTLQVVRPQDLVFISPWDKRVQVPPFENESENFVPVVLIERGNRLALENGQAVAAIAARVNERNSINAVGATENPKSNQTALEEVAREFGLAPDDVDRAIRAWGKKTTDPYEKGLAALYERAYPEASKLPASSLEVREQEERQIQSKVVDAAFFLGYSLHEEGRYRESADAYRKALSVRGEDSGTMNNLAMSLMHSGDYVGAESLFRTALAARERAPGPTHPDTAASLNNLAALLSDKGDYQGAEPLLRRAFGIDEKALGSEHPATATIVNNLAGLSRAKGDYAEAERLYRRSLAIDEKALGPEHPDTAIILNNLADLLEDKGDYAGAEPLIRRALAIDEKALGPEHPMIAIGLNNMGKLLIAKKDYAGAEPLLRRALAIDEKALGPEHPFTAASLHNLAVLLKDKGDYAGGEPLIRRAIAIREKALDAEHPLTAESLNSLAELLLAKGDYAGGEPLFRRAIAIDEKALGPEHPHTADHLKNLAGVLKAKGDYAEAEPLLRRALAIFERVFGADSLGAQQLRSSLQEVQERLRQKQ